MHASQACFDRAKLFANLSVVGYFRPSKLLTGSPALLSLHTAAGWVWSDWGYASEAYTVPSYSGPSRKNGVSGMIRFPQRAKIAGI